MPVIILLMYIVVLALAMTYSIGGVGMGMAIFVGLALLVATMLVQAKRDRLERAKVEPGHHHDAHGGSH